MTRKSKFDLIGGAVLVGLLLWAILPYFELYIWAIISLGVVLAAVYWGKVLLRTP